MRQYLTKVFQWFFNDFLGTTDITDSCFQPGECTDSYQVAQDIVEDEFECLETCKATPNCSW